MVGGRGLQQRDRGLAITRQLEIFGGIRTRQRCTSQVLDSMNKLGLYDILCIDQSSILL